MTISRKEWGALSASDYAHAVADALGSNIRDYVKELNRLALHATTAEASLEACTRLLDLVLDGPDGGPYRPLRSLAASPDDLHRLAMELPDEEQRVGWLIRVIDYLLFEPEE